MHIDPAMAGRVLKLPHTSSLAPANARSSSGSPPCGLPCGRVLPVRPGRANSWPAVATAVSKSRPQVGENAAISLQNLVYMDGALAVSLGLVNGTGQRKPEQWPSSHDDTAEVATAEPPLPGSHEVRPCFPTYPPRNMHRQLSTVDVLEKIGISRHFAVEIKSILDVTYSCWLQRDEEIVLDLETCAMAFRILRMNGYDVSSDDLSHVSEASSDFSDTVSLLELYKASQVSISEDELILDSIGSWTGCLLKEQLSSSPVQRTPLFREVQHALDSPFYTTLDRLEHKRNIEQFDAMEHQMLKTPYSPGQTSQQDLVALGAMDFSRIQSVYQRELQHLDSWVKESRLDQLPFARQKLAYFYLSAAGTMFPPELSDARVVWAKNGVLTTVVDDFFDVAGSKQELENLAALVETWDEHEETAGGCCCSSEHVEILFSAIYGSVNELGAKASAAQGRDVTGHLVEIWQELLRSMMTEVEWKESGHVPTAEEYMGNAVVTFTLGPIVLPALYFAGPKIAESVVTGPEYNELFRLMSTCGRLLNDVQTYEREYVEGKLNSVSLLVLRSGGSMTIEEARREMQGPIDACRRDLLRLVLREDSAVPRPCRELFWDMCKTCYFFYSGSDAFSSPDQKAGAVDALIHLPLQLASGNLLSGLDLSDSL